MLIRKGDAEQAIECLETIHRQLPEFPKEATEYYRQTIVLLQEPDTE